MRSFRGLCGNNVFVVPRNQRGFSWAIENVEDVFHDLHLAGQEAHYMGPVIVTRTDRSDFQDDDHNNVSEFFLEDGQQRVTTFFLIADALLGQLQMKLPDHTIEHERLRELRKL